MSGAIKVQDAMGGTVAKVTLNRPERFNAFDREMIRELGDLVRGVEDSAKLKVLLLTGEGKAFCAGGDFACSSTPRAAAHGATRASTRCSRRWRTARRSW